METEKKLRRRAKVSRKFTNETRDRLSDVRFFRAYTEVSKTRGEAQKLHIDGKLRARSRPQDATVLRWGPNLKEESNRGKKEQKTLTKYEAEQIVNRLYQLPHNSADYQRSVAPDEESRRKMTKDEIDAMTKRLSTLGRAAPERRRVQTTDMKKYGTVLSYAWKGWATPNI